MDDDLVPVVGYPTEDDASAAIKELVVHGIGATIREIEPRVRPDAPPLGAAEPPSMAPEPPVADDPDVELRFEVMVVEGDRFRALEILGIVDERALEEASVERARRTAPSLKVLIPVLLGAFILLPAIAFYLSYKASGG